MTQTKSAFLSIENVSKTFGNFKANNNVSFSIESGSIFGLLGPNGAGKTTLLRMITGIINPDSGRIVINGNAGGSLEKIAKTVGYLPEERGLYKKMEAGEQTIFFGRIKGLTHSEAEKRAKNLFEKFGLEKWWNSPIEKLSKGMQQKVQFIITILHSPTIIVLDEPLSGLDPVNSQLINSTITSLRDTGATIIFSTHRMEQVEEICDSIVLINKGKKVLDGDVKDIKNTFKKHQFIVTYSEPPQSLPQQTELDTYSWTMINNQEIMVTLKDTSVEPKTILRELLDTGSMSGFREILPSLNEIFISQVSETTIINH